jgi:hypothetical protein
MKFLKAKTAGLCLLVSAMCATAQIPKRTIAIKKIASPVKIDGIINEQAWKQAPVADKFVCLRPTPFKPENPDNASTVYFLYDNEGIYVGGYFYEKEKDSMAMELKGRDGFGNNDFAGIIFDTYQDKLNGFEYFVTPLGEQWDAKVSPNNNGNSEDFSWNAVWQSKAALHNDGWSFEMFIPYSAIRFGKKKIQEWGLNIVRKRRKSDEQLFWQPIDPNVNGFLTQEGTITGLQDITPPLRLQFSPYISTYLNHEDANRFAAAKSETTINGGMDVKYGINQAFTLDMTLVPDFGQVQTDNRILNLSPFEQQFSENRTFFTEGTELFNKGNLFYSRRIGRVGNKPLRYWEIGKQIGSDETILKNPEQIKLINATKISGRTQKGLGIGFLNAVTNNQHAIIENINSKEKRKIETEPLTNYNVLVLDQTLKHNSSISFVNTNVLRNGEAKDANVSALLFDLNNKKNTYNFGGNISISALGAMHNKIETGYAHSLYFGKTSGQFNFRYYQDLYGATYDKSDLGYFTNNNYMENGLWMGYNWVKPKNWYNQLRLNMNLFHNRLVKPMDALKRSNLMFQNAGFNVNANAQTKKLWWLGFNFNVNADYNDFYEPRSAGRVFRNKGSKGMSVWFESNSVKKFSWSSSLFAGTGGVFNRKSTEVSLSAKQRFSNKFSLDHSVSITTINNQPGWADNIGTLKDTIIFSRRNVRTVENVLSLKYNFNNVMGLSLRGRHYWTKVDPKQFYELDKYGDLQTPATTYTGNVKQNFNFLSVDMVYNWQFAQGSFFSVVWKDIADNFNRGFEKNYFKNLGKTIEGNQFNSLSVRMIYFLDYLTAKKKWKKTKTV